ncbi:uncharacterized protein LOC142234025 [Haematobia irritans]|uniref:uncharacterized protein LOC142234025 n=1 Tax=Haematobia irritans TaxID=7368 RepID=UPI003F4FFDDA
MDSKEKGKSKRNIVGFREEWKNKFPWLAQTPNGKKCMVCDINIAGGLSHIERHAARDCHIQKIKIAKSTPKIDSILENVSKSCPSADLAKQLEVKLCLFLAEHNVPFTILDPINLIIKSGIPDSQVAKKFVINRHKAQKIITTVTGPENTKSITKFCSENYYSIVVDESTDCTVIKHLAIIVRIFNTKCQDRFLSLESITDSTGKGIAEKLVEVLREHNIPLKRMVGFGADNCSVMMGKYNGAQAILKKSLPNLFVTGCICHILNLASCAAFSILPKQIDKLMREINHHFCNSPSRKQDFLQFQEYFGTEMHVILGYASTRWLSRKEVVDRILEQWEPLQYYFNLKNFESEFKTEKIEFISQELTNSITKLYFLFLSYILNLVIGINIEMQSEEARIHILLPRLEFLYKQIARNFIQKEALDCNDIFHLNLDDNNLPIENIFCGTEAEIFLETTEFDEQTIRSFKLNVKKFYVKLCNSLKTKLEISDRNMLRMFNNFSQENVLAGSTNNIIPLLTKLFPDEKKILKKLIHNIGLCQIFNYLNNKNMTMSVIFGITSASSKMN